MTMRHGEEILHETLGTEACFQRSNAVHRNLSIRWKSFSIWSSILEKYALPFLMETFGNSVRSM